MAALTDEQRRDLWARMMRENTDGVSISKAELRAALDAIDDRVDSNAASMNSAIPQPARGALSASQKARLLSLIVEARFGGGVLTWRR